MLKPAKGHFQITNQLLYQLSYAGNNARSVAQRPGRDKRTGIVIPLNNQMPQVCANSLKFGNRSVAAWMRITAKGFFVRAQTTPKKMPLTDRTTMA